MSDYTNLVALLRDRQVFMAQGPARIVQLGHEAADAIEALSQRVAELEAAQRFAGLVLKNHRNDGYPGDMDGGTLQHLALECGLIEWFSAPEPCGEHCSCSESALPGEWPLNCLHSTAAGKSCIDAAIAAQADKGEA